MEDEEAAGLSQDVINKMLATSEVLSSGRKQRTIPSDLKSVEQVSALKSKSVEISSSPIISLDVHERQDLIAAGTADGDCILYNRILGKKLTTFHTKHAINRTVFHTSLDLLFTASDQISFWSISQQSTQPIRSIRTHSDMVTGLSLHPSGDFILSSSRDRTWAFSDVTTGTCLYQNKTGSAPYSCISFHPDGLIFGTGSEENMIEIWDVKNQQQATSFSVHKGKITDLSFSENGYYMASSSADGIVHFWDLRKLKSIANLDLHSPVTSIEFDDSGSYVAVALQNGDVNVYQSKVWKQLANFKGSHNKGANAVTWAGKTASLLVSAGSDGLVKFYE